MNDYVPVLCDTTLFRGRWVPQSEYFRRYAPTFARLVKEWGREKVDKYYDWLFRQLSRMEWGQWFSVRKFAPEQRMLGLLYWALETIYQSDIFSQFEFRTVDGDLRVYVVEPSPDRKKRLNDFLGRGKYNLFDLYGYLRVAKPDYRPDIFRPWLLLEDVKVQTWGDTTTAEPAPPLAEDGMEPPPDD